MAELHAEDRSLGHSMSVRHYLTRCAETTPCCAAGCTGPCPPLGALGRPSAAAAGSGDTAAGRVPAGPAGTGSASLAGQGAAGGLMGRFDILRQLLRNRGQKRNAEQNPTGTPVVRGYGVRAQGLIDQVNKKFPVSDPRVQILIESICDSNPITKLAPVEEKIFMAALGECEVTGTDHHVNERWIRAMKMENRRHIFDPICPKKSCCNATEMISTALLCPGGGIAAPICSANNCSWSYDCSHKTKLEISEVPSRLSTNAANADDASEFGDSAVADTFDDQYVDAALADAEYSDAAVADTFDEEYVEYTDAAVADTFDEEYVEYSDAAVADTFDNEYVDAAVADAEYADAAFADTFDAEYVDAAAEADFAVLDSAIAEADMYDALADYYDQMDQADAATAARGEYYPETANSNEANPAIPIVLGVLCVLTVVGIIVVIIVSVVGPKKEDERV